MSAKLDVTQLAAQEQFSRQSKKYATGHILEDVSDVIEALNFIPLDPPARVLDVACGAGHTGLHLASLGHEVTLGDLSEAMLERTREAAMRRNLKVETRQHAAENLPYAAATFDLVTCRVAPHHFSSPAAFVREVARVLKPNGWFLLIDGTVPDGNSEADQWLNTVEKLRDPSHERLVAAWEWNELCTIAGLRVERQWMGRKKQPDLQWYFETAATPADNRQKVIEMIERASSTVRDAYDLREENGKQVWWWPMLHLIARK